MMRRRVATTALCLVAIAATMGTIRKFAPEPYVPLVTEKLARLEELRDEVTTLFVGSSLVYRHLAPDQFDRVLTRKGHASRSFNLALPGARNAESLHLLRRVAAMELPHLEYVIIETGGWQEPIEAENVRTQRVVYWHELDETRRAVEAVWTTQSDPWRRLDQARLHIFAFMLNATNVARLRLAFTDVLPSPRQELAGRGALGPKNDGFTGLPPVHERGGGRAERVNAVAARIEERLAQRRRLGPPPTTVNPAWLDSTQAAMFRELNDAIYALGAEPIQVVSPIVAPRFELLAAQAAGLVPVLFDFNDPDVYPQFYTLESRADQVHLHRESAIQYTRMVATQFSKHLDRMERRRR